MSDTCLIVNLSTNNS